MIFVSRAISVVCTDKDKLVASRSRDQLVAILTQSAAALREPPTWPQFAAMFGRLGARAMTTIRSNDVAPVVRCEVQRRFAERARRSTAAVDDDDGERRAYDDADASAWSSHIEFNVALLCDVLGASIDYVVAGNARRQPQSAMQERSNSLSVGRLSSNFPPIVLSVDSDKDSVNRRFGIRV